MIQYVAERDAIELHKSIGSPGDLVFDCKLIKRAVSLTKNHRKYPLPGSMLFARKPYMLFANSGIVSYDEKVRWTDNRNKLSDLNGAIVLGLCFLKTGGHGDITPEWYYTHVVAITLLPADKIINYFSISKSFSENVKWD